MSENISRLNNVHKLELKESEVRSIVKETVQEVLLSLGIDAKDPIKTQRDFQRLRSWGDAIDDVKKKSRMTLVGMILTGLAAIFVMGTKKFTSAFKDDNEK